MTKNSQIDSILKTAGTTAITLAARNTCIEEHASFKLLPFIDDIDDINNANQQLLLEKLKVEINTNTVAATESQPILGGIINMAVNGGQHFVSYFYNPSTHELIIAEPANWLLKITEKKLKDYFNQMFPEKEDVKLLGHITDQQVPGSQHCSLLSIHNLAHASNFFKEKKKTLADYMVAVKADPINALPGEAKEIKYLFYEDAALNVICQLPEKVSIKNFAHDMEFECEEEFIFSKIFQQEQSVLNEQIEKYQTDQGKYGQPALKEICLNAVNIITGLSVKRIQAKKNNDTKKEKKLNKCIIKFDNLLTTTEKFLSKNDYNQLQDEKEEVAYNKLVGANNSSVLPELKTPRLKDIFASQKLFFEIANKLEKVALKETKLQKIKRIIHDFFISALSQHSSLNRHDNYSIKHTAFQIKSFINQSIFKVKERVDKGQASIAPKKTLRI